MIIDRTHDPLMRLTIGRTRRGTCHGSNLVAAHRDVGRMLASDVARSLSLEDVDIEHVAGRSVDVRVVPGTEPVIVAMLRSGLFVAEGVRDALLDASLVLYRDERDLHDAAFEGRLVVVVDAVINTGACLRRVVDAARARLPLRVVVVSLVGYRPSVEALAESLPEVEFVVGRLSERTYVGRGPTDTGARLFGTIGWEAG